MTSRAKIQRPPRKSTRGNSAGIAPHRRAAFRAYWAMLHEGAFAAQAIDRACREIPGVEAGTRAFIYELAASTVRERDRLRHLWGLGASRSPIETQPELAAALDLAAHEILRMKTPRPVAVHEGVELAGWAAGAWARGFANAVLRRLSEASTAPETPPPDASPPLALTLRFGMPLWLAEWALAQPLAPLRERLGPWYATRPKLTLRARPERGGDPPRAAEILRQELVAEGLEASLSLRTPGAIAVGGNVNPGWLAAIASHRAVVQNEAAQLIVHLLAPRADERILDVCAAPGGKALALHDWAPGAQIIAVDAHTRKAAAMRDFFAATAPAIEAVHGEAVAWAAAQPRESFDAVLLDAPCSGLGTIRRHPEIGLRVNPEIIAAKAAVQKRLLDAMAPLVKPRGRLVYAVCSIAPEEGVERVREFLGTHPEFAVARPPGSPELWAELVNPEQFLDTGCAAPEADWLRLDGFFAALLWKQRA